MKFHIKKEEINHSLIKNEDFILDNIFYTGGDKKRPIGLNFVDRKFKGIKDGKIKDHKIIDIISKSKYEQHSFLLIYHWYERKYNVNIIQGDNYVITHPNRKIKIIKDTGYGELSEIIDSGLVPEVRIRKKELHELVRQKYINESLNSSRFKGFSIYYEYYYDFFPNIEQFSFEEFVGIEFVKYLLDLFPQLKWVDHPKRSYERYKSQKSIYEVEKKYGYVWLEYKFGIPVFFPNLPGPEQERYLYHYSNLERKKPKVIENEIREDIGLPKIGEGWISETTLFYQIKNHFKDEEVIHHGKPSWLGLQHVDIWIPKHKIGIEYQGLQHDKPIDFFGGEEGFIEGQKRDLRKKELFNENNSILIEVREGYKLNHIVKQIKTHLK